MEDVLALDENLHGQALAVGEGRMFSMTMMVTLDPAVADFNTVQERLAADGERLSMQVLIQREDVFQAMYEI